MPQIIEEDEIESLAFSSEDKPVEAAKSRNYIDDDELTKMLSTWKVLYDANKGAGEPPLPIPEAVGASILEMTEKMAKRHNFRDYSYIDEMKGNAIIHCLKYLHNFNPSVISEKKGKVSAFGYINMIIWRSFTNYIELEKEQQYLKYKSFELMGGMEAFQDEEMATASGEDGEDGGMSIGILGSDFIQKARKYEEEKGLDKPKIKGKKNTFDNFMFSFDQEELVE